MFAWCVAYALASMPTEPELFASVLARIDLDGNGTLSQAEYLRVDGATNFAAMDADRDNVVTAVELAAWVKVTQPRPMVRTHDRPDAPPPGDPPPTWATSPVGTHAVPPATSPVGTHAVPPATSPVGTHAVPPATSPVGTHAVPPATAPASPPADSTSYRVLVLGGMVAAAGVVAWLILRSPPRRPRVSPRR